MIRINCKIKPLKIWFIVYLFLAVFQPPLMPFPLIYVMGFITCVAIIKENGFVIRLEILRDTGILKILRLFLFMLLYLIIVAFIDSFLDDKNLLSNRIRCVNQLLVLSGIQFIEIWYILILSKKLNYNFEDVFEKIIFVGAIQGILAVLAYINPTIRSLFLKFADKTIFTNSWVIERRGYGFSGTLIDTFGYGMGLLGGYLILSDLTKNRIKKLIWLVLIVFSIFTNARTGIIVLGIAILLKMIQGDTFLRQIVKVSIAVPIIILVFYVVIPKVLEIGMTSNNTTISWVTKDIQSFYNMIRYGEQASSSITEVSFLSNFGNLPQNPFELIFGSGHSIYDTGEILGFRTDIGYINLLWEFGIIGSIISTVGIILWMYKPMIHSGNSFVKSILLLNIISYLAVLFKAILIGYNPGVFVNYASVAFVYYFKISGEKNKKPIFCLLYDNMHY